jgi:hypothetical protein
VTLFLLSVFVSLQLPRLFYPSASNNGWSRACMLPPEHHDKTWDICPAVCVWRLLLTGWQLAKGVAGHRDWNAERGGFQVGGSHECGVVTWLRARLTWLLLMMLLQLSCKCLAFGICCDTLPCVACTFFTLGICQMSRHCVCPFFFQMHNCMHA